MTNPYFDRSPLFKDNGGATVGRTPNGYPTMPGYQPGRAGAQSATQPGAYGQYAQRQYGSTGYGSPQAAYGSAPAPASSGTYGLPQNSYGEANPHELSSLEYQYAAPAATNVDRGRMTYDDVIVRTAALFAVIVLMGAVSWLLSTSVETAGLGMGLMVLGGIGGLVLGLVNSFKREPQPVLIVAYAACEGALLGGLSGLMNTLYPGIVLQAVVGTFVVFAVMLGAYCFAGFRVSAKGARVLLGAMIGYVLFSLVNSILTWTGAVNDPWGLRGVEVAGIPLGLIVGALAVVMAAVTLALDFEAIDRGVQRGLPTRYAWAGAFGLTVTLVWLYVEILRLLAILRGND